MDSVLVSWVIGVGLVFYFVFIGYLIWYVLSWAFREDDNGKP